MKKVEGNSYPIKDFIKSKGGKWNTTEKCWYVPEDVHDEVRIKMEMESGRKKVERPSHVAEPTGQLWEDCRRCGKSPIYISLQYLCDECGRKH